MSHGPFTFMDTFSNTQSSGWGVTDTGQNWTTSNLVLRENYGWGTIVNMANTGLGTARIQLPQDGIPEQTKDSVLMRFRITSPATWPLTDFGPMLSFKAGNTFYYLAIQANWAEIAIGVYINGYRYELNRRPFPVTKNTEFWVRFERGSSGMLGKIWKSGTAEPRSWTVSSGFWDGSKPIGAGSPGIFKKGTRDSHDIEILDYVYYAASSTQKTGFPVDTFDRESTNGLGISTSGHAWEGAFSSDPAAYALNGFGFKLSSSDTARITFTDTQEHAGTIGPITTNGDVEAYAKFIMGNNSNGGDVKFRLGIRGRPAYAGGITTPLGYIVQVQSNQSHFYIYSRGSAGGSYASVSAGALGFTAVTGTAYHLRFQYADGGFRARCWADGTAEPTTWQVEKITAAYPSGTLWLAMNQTIAGTRTVDILDIQYKTPVRDAAVVKNFATTGELFVTPYETSASFTARHTDDANDNATITARYKPTNATAWINHTGSFTISGKNRGFSITGLQPATSYNLEVTWQDPDGIVGSNPMYMIFTTTEKGVVAQDIKVTNVNTASVDVEASYLRDSDANATATIAHRKTTMETPIVEDYFVDEGDGEFLQNIDSVRGGDWLKHPSATPEVNAVLRQMRFYAATVSKENKVLYYHTNQAPVDEYDVVGEFFAAQLNGRTGVAARMSNTLETYYGAGINADESTGTWVWELFKVVAGTRTVLETLPFTSDVGIVYEIRLVIRNAYKALVVNGVELLRTTDNEITDRGLGGYYASDILEGNSTNHFQLDSFFLTYRSSPGEWTAETPMTLDRVARKATASITGLETATVYDFRVTFADPDGSSSPLLITAQTTGESISLAAMGATTYATSAVLDVIYDYDSNNNSYMSFQYKSVMETVWKTIPLSHVRADRNLKKFSVTISGLIPSLTYEVRATVTDPDGIMEGSLDTLTGLFTTDGFVPQEEKRTKHYAWKIYDPKGKYVGTIPDAPEPEFSLHQNGGVTDLSFTLNRSFQDISVNKTIDFQNRVDIWAIDPSSDGMGPNMIADPDCDPAVGAWFHSPISAYVNRAGPDGSSALRLNATTATQYETLSNPIEVGPHIPLVVRCMAKATGAKLRMYVQAYNVNDEVIDSSQEIIDTVGIDWQELKINYTTPETTSYVRVTLRNTGRGVMYADKFVVLSREVLVYRGKIEAFTPKIDENGEEVDIEVLGLVSLLSDDYIEFLQFVEIQPAKDISAKRVNYGAKDPGDMLKMVIDEAKRQNPLFELYYTSESIRNTGQLAQYTFRDQQVRACMDKIRNLCPSGWHYYIEADGLVVLRGPEHATTHNLRIGVEILRFEVEKSIRNLKNFVRVKGRQDEDKNEPDGHGSINYTAFDQKSINKYGKRMVFIRDAQITDPETAKMIGDGRLDEYNREEQRAGAYVPDEKGYYFETGSLRGYNIEAFRPGDNIKITDPHGSMRNTYWNKFRWDEDAWDMADVFAPLPESVPIVTVQNHGTYAQLELSERPPSQVGDFSRLFRWMADKESD